MRSSLRLFTVTLLLLSSTVCAKAQTWQDLLARANSLRNTAQFDSALVLAKQALEITEREYGKEDTSVVRALNSIGVTYYYQGKYTEVEQFWRRSLDIREKVLGPEHPDVATTLSNLAQLYDNLGRYAEAEPLCKRALDIREKVLGPEHPDVAATLNNLALLYFNQERYAEAEPLYKRALVIREKALGPDHAEVARSLNNLALLYSNEGRYTDAEPLYERGLSILEKTLGPDHPDVAMELNNLALVYFNQGRYADAEPLDERALSIRERALGPDHPDVAMSLNSLASVHHQQGRYADAEPLYTRALSIYEEALGPDHPDLTYSLTNLAILNTEQGRYAEAEPLCKRALSINEKALGPDAPRVAMVLNYLANLYSAQGRYADAEPLYQRALSIREKALGAEHPDVAQSLHALATLRLAQKSFAESVKLQKRAFEIRCQDFRDGSQVMSERNALEYSRFLQEEASNYLTVLSEVRGHVHGSDKGIEKTVLSTKGQVSDGILARFTSVRRMSALLDSLNAARLALSNLYVAGSGTDQAWSYQTKLTEATQRKEACEAELARSSSEFRNEQDQWKLDASKVAEDLPSGSVLVEFMRYDHRPSVRDTDVEPRYLAVVLASSGIPSVFPLGSAAAIDTAVWNCRQQFETAQGLDRATYASASDSLYGLVWRPFAGLLAGASTVFIAPDGDLDLVSFAGLIDDNGQYLIENYPIHYLSTGRDLIRLKDKPPSGSGLLAMGDPDYDLSFPGSALANLKTNVSALLSVINLRSSCEQLNKLNVASLPGTRTEVSAVSAQWKQNRSESEISCLGAEATEENFKKDAPGKRVIHLATHGFYLSDECKPKQTARGLGTESPGFVGENPLLLCGFLLAGANKHGEGAKEANREDGIVTAEDVAGLNLTGTDLVVLSSCESGLGTVKSGEGVYGLRRAFQMAGARTVISTLWAIDDKSTAEFMGQLFSAKDEPLPQTMQRIALSRISSLRTQGKSDHPFYWAAFVATGDWK